MISSVITENSPNKQKYKYFMMNTILKKNISYIIIFRNLGFTVLID